MRKKSFCRAPALCALLLAAGAACADPTYQFDIRGATLEAALRQFASQTGLQIAYFTEVAEGLTAPAVSGAYTAEEALQSLLGASGLTFERIDENTVAIHAASSSSVAFTGRDPIAMSRAPAGSLRLAQADVRSADRPGAAGNESRSIESRGYGPRVEVLSEVVVTGSHIRGVINETTPMMVFDREYIQRSGYSNMMQLVESLPVNFKGGASGSSEVGPFGLAPNSGQNLTRGTGFNLRGLGSVSTLTLINGRRVAPSAQGQFVDVSTIPLSAVERIEILTDGASAIYGADAVAGVVNIILRKDFQGMETSLHYGSATDGSVDEQRVSHTMGDSWDGGNALLTLEYYKRSELDVRDRDFIIDAGSAGPTWLLPRRKLGTLLFALDQDLPANFDLNSTVLYSYEEVDMASSTAGDPTVLTQNPVTNQWSASAGVGYGPFGDWRFALDGTIARVKPDTDFTYTDSQTGDIVLLVTDYRDEFDTWSLDLKGDGSLFALPAGLVRLAVGASYREDDLISTRVRVIPPTGPEVRANDARQVTSAFGEVYVPIVGERQQVPFAKRIELSIAGRYDNYSDFGSTTNPKVGVVWTPIEGLDLRASVSSSFRAPTVAEKALVTRGVQISTDVLDAPDGGPPIPMFYLIGSAELTAEESDNLAVGFTFRPQSLPGAELSMNYFEIDYTNRISSPPFDAGALSRRGDFGELITEIANDAEAQAYLASRLAMGDLYIDWMGTGATGVRYVLDLRQQNAARTQTSGFDLTTAWSFSSGANAFDLNLSVTHLTEILTSLTSSTTTFDQIDTYNQPLDWRARAMGTWVRGGLSTTLAVSYADNYMNDSFAIDAPIASWTTVDLNLSYDFAGAAQPSFLDGSRLAVGVSNLFDKEPPHADSPFFPVGYDAFNADAMGRFVTARFSKRW